METSDVRTINSARKEHVCDWCGEAIEKGTFYVRWFTYGENTTARLHRECFDAMCKADLDEELPPVGMYKRGCSE